MRRIVTIRVPLLFVADILSIVAKDTHSIEILYANSTQNFNFIPPTVINYVFLFALFYYMHMIKMSYG